MTFEEYAATMTWRTVAERTKAKAAWEAGKNSVIVPVDKLKQIEEAIAFELGGEPCGLHEAHKLVKAMIQSSNGQAK
jgi:hypothetical protein